MEAIQVTRDGGLVTITLDRPDKKNAINAAGWNELDQTFTEIAIDPEVRAVVLTCAGGNFSAGADLGGNPSGKGLTGRDVQPIVAEMRVVGDIILRLYRLPKPTLAVVDGVAVGVAMGLVLACDLVIASDRARFCEIFAKRGIALDGGTSWLLPRRIGINKAKQLAFFADMVGAEEALRIGLVNELFPAAELAKAGQEWGQRLASGPTLALSLSKRLLDASNSVTLEKALEDEARAQHITYTSDDMREGMAAYIQRREPKFEGR
jgi:2-(1,2-epoxy-1,2-dihydrophenyl)acetyl-CoA isomerase